jgi:pyruvate kinase
MSEIKIIASLGPATNTESSVKMMKDRKVSFVRVNMSHSSIQDLNYYITLAQKVDIPFIIDTEGSQVRTGPLDCESIYYEENKLVRLHGNLVHGTKSDISLKPGEIIKQLQPGDLLKLDFNTLMLRVSDVSTVENGFIICRVIIAGNCGGNKAVVINAGSGRSFTLPPLTEKDYQSVEVGLRENIKHIAVSFVRCANDIRLVREATRGAMKIISKIECRDALMNLDEIIEETDYILLDRGDLSHEIPIEKVPFTQKIILTKANRKNKGVYVATNLLETMIEKQKPTRAEVNDVINTILDGASGLILSAETAIGKHPIECINVLNKLITHADMVAEGVESFKKTDNLLVEILDRDDYLLSSHSSGTLIPPHGGKLIDCYTKNLYKEEEIKSLKKVVVGEKAIMDTEQIAIGTFSPLEGFMTEEELHSVLHYMKLPNGVVWTMPIILDVSEDVASSISIGQEIQLADENENPIAIMQVEDKYKFDLNDFAKNLFGTSDTGHAGVKMLSELNPVFLGGKINLLRRKNSEYKEYELTPKQTRTLFEEKGWARIVGFHTRNVIHRSHEFIQMEAMKLASCDGLFVHPVIGRKKIGDYNTKYIIQSYEKMQESFYPPGKVIFATYVTYSRYAGPREAVFTALCRKNFGCSHFIIGRDHTGVGNYYGPHESQDIFDTLPDIGIEIVPFNEVFYSPDLNGYLHASSKRNFADGDFCEISGTQAREMLKSGKMPPDWLMRPEISELVISGIKSGDKVFIE